jgi:RHS repeat-associated protein
MSASYPSLFPSPSFQISATSMSGGSTATTGYGPVYTYAVPPPTPTTGYAPNGNLRSYTDSVMGTWNFGYDTLNRLTSAQNTATTSVSTQFAGAYGCWTYDGFGNRTAETWLTTACPSSLTPTAAYNGSNRMTWTSVNAAGSNMQYDGAGNVLFDGANSYAYDPEGRLCAVRNTATGGPVYTAYIYGADGARVAKLNTGSLTSSSGSLTCWTPSVSDTLQSQYLLGLGGEQVTELDGGSNWKHTNVWAGGKILATYDGQGLHFPLTDPLGTKRIQVNASGLVDETCLSLPYGNGLSCSGDDATEHHFTGKERDTESGNDYFEARYYSSSMGRFMSPDWSAKASPVPYATFADPQSLNLYSYVRNNPLNRTDADGHTCNTGAWFCNLWDKAFHPDRLPPTPQSPPPSPTLNPPPAPKPTAPTPNQTPTPKPNPDPVITALTDVGGVGAAVIRSGPLGIAFSALSIRNDPSRDNLKMTGAQTVIGLLPEAGLPTALIPAEADYLNWEFQTWLNGAINAEAIKAVQRNTEMGIAPSPGERMGDCPLNMCD